MKENNAVALVFLSILLGCGGTALYPPASGTLTVWTTTTYESSYTSTYTTLLPTAIMTTSSTTVVSTVMSDLTATFKNKAFSITKEYASNYYVVARIVEIPLEPGMQGYSPKVTVTFNYRSNASMTLEEISIDTWNRMRTSSEAFFTYYPEKIEVEEGTGSWKSEISYVDPYWDRVYLVFIGPLPEILSVDLEQVSEDIAVATTTMARTFTSMAYTTVNTAITRTYVKTITTWTYTETELPDAYVIGFAVFAVIAAVSIIYEIRKRRKAKPAPFVLPPPPPI